MFAVCWFALCYGCLSGVGAKYNRLQLIEAVLYLSTQILDGYRQTNIVTDEAVSLVDTEG